MKINFVSKFFVIKDFLCYIDTHGFMYLNSIQKIHIGFAFCDLLFSHQKGIFFTNQRNGEAFYIDDNQNVNSLGFSISSIQLPYIFTYSRITNETSIIDENLNQIFNSKIASGQYFVENGNVYDYGMFFLRKLNFYQSAEWCYKIENERNEIVKIIGSNKSYMFICLSNNSILVLNKETGQEIDLIDVYGIELQNIFLHPKDGYIYCLSHSFLKINTETLEVEEKKEIATYNAASDSVNNLYGIRSSSYQGDYISFTSFTSRRAGEAKWIGLFDYKKGEIAWHHELLEDGDDAYIPPGETPQLANGKLYVLDSNNTLHILDNISILQNM